MGQTLSRAPRITWRRARPLQGDPYIAAKDQPKTQEDAHANQTRQNEAVVNDRKSGNTGSVPERSKLNRRQIAWVRSAEI